MQQLPLELTSNINPTFDNFIPGVNLECMAALQEKADAFKRSGFSVDYLWGPNGSGKTHLLKALSNAIREKGGCCSWFIPESDFELEQLTVSNLLLVDDVTALTNLQEARLFHALIEAQTQNIAVVAAGRLPPVNLEIREDVRSRLAWGHVYELKPLTDEELKAALWQVFWERGLELSQPVQDYLLHHFARDMSSLMRLLLQLDRYALASKRAITIPLIKQMLSEKTDLFDDPI